MPSKRTLTAILWILMLTAARAADFATTHHFSPDLALEGNPLVTRLGGHWATLVTVNVAGVALIAACTVLHARARPRTHLSGQARNTWEFAALSLYGRRLTPAGFMLRRLLWLRLPARGHRRAFLELAGFVLPPAMVTASLLTVYSWFAIRAWHWETFTAVYNQTGIWLIVLGALPVAALAEVAHHREEFRRARSTEGK